MAKNKVLFSNLGVSPKDKIINISIILIIIVAVLLIYFLVLSPYINAFFTKIKNKMNLSKEISEGGKLTYDKSRYIMLADALYSAMKGAGTDTNAIYNIFNQMQTRADVLQLIDSFGTRDKETLAQWMRGELLLSVSKINSILSGKGINYAF